MRPHSRDEPRRVAKKKKLRVALNKNRQKRTRANDLTRSYGDEGPGRPRGRSRSACGPGESCRAIGRSSTDVGDEAAA